MARASGAASLIIGGTHGQERYSGVFSPMSVPSGRGK